MTNKEATKFYTPRFSAGHKTKTRKEVLLEKFPNIKVDACGIPCLNPCEMDPIYSNKNCLRKWEHDCASCRKGYWNAPVESEEE